MFAGIVAITMSLMTSQPKIIPNFDTTLDREVVEYCFDAEEEFGVSATLLIAIIEAESNGDENAQSECGAVGLMQIMPKYNQDRLEDIGGNDLFDPQTNVRCGASILLDLFEEHGDIDLVLSKYRGKYSEAYINKIMTRQEELNKYID